MLKILLILVNIFLSLNKISPTKENAEIINENEIKCGSGTVTYQINNDQNKKYLVLIKNYYINEFSLYEGNNELEYETHSYNDYFLE